MPLQVYGTVTVGEVASGPIGPIVRLYLVKSANSLSSCTYLGTGLGTVEVLHPGLQEFKMSSFFSRRIGHFRSTPVKLSRREKLLMYRS